jgi:hypothetical protein
MPSSGLVLLHTIAAPVASEIELTECIQPTNRYLLILVAVAGLLDVACNNVVFSVAQHEFPTTGSLGFWLGPPLCE